MGAAVWPAALGTVKVCACTALSVVHVFGGLNTTIVVTPQLVTDDAKMRRAAAQGGRLLELGSG